LSGTAPGRRRRRPRPRFLENRGEWGIACGTSGRGLMFENWLRSRVYLDANAVNKRATLGTTDFGSF
jgi:hypothetical protein